MRLAFPATVAVALAMLLPGCLTGDDPAALMPAAPAAPLPADVTTALAFLGSAVDGLAFGGEPSIAVAPDGTLYVAAPHIPATAMPGLIGVGPPVTDAVFRSTDHGYSWRKVGNGPERSTHDRFSSGDADLAIDDDGVLYLAGLGNGVPFSVSTDRGETWEPRTPPTRRPVDREWIEAWGSGEVVVSWQTANQTSDTFQLVAQVARSHDGGRTWSEPRNVSAAGWIAGPIVRDAGRGGFLLPHADADAIQVATWEDAGASEVRLARIPRPPAADSYIFPVAAVDAAGNYYVAWSLAPRGQPVASPVGEPASIWLSSSRDGGATWSEPWRVSAEGENAIFPWLVAGSEGRIALTYLSSPSGGHPNRAVGEWFAVAAVSTDALAEAPRFEVARLWPAPVHRGSVCGYGGACLSTSPDMMGDRGLLDFFEAALTPGGELVATFAVAASAFGQPVTSQFNGLAAAKQVEGVSLLASVGEVRDPAWSRGG